MNCPLVLYNTGTLGTVDYYSPCECSKLCDYTGCGYRRCGFLVQFPALGATTANTVSISGKKCGGAAPLVLEATGALVTNGDLTAGAIYRVYPQTLGDVLRFVVASA